jgi:adenylate cyclase
LGKLIILQPGQHRVYDMTETIITIGRAPDNVLWLDDPSLSRRHAEIRKLGNDWVVRDAGSFNGTYLNDVSITQEGLRAGDRVQLGTSVIYFVPSPEAVAGGDTGRLTPVGGDATAEAAQKEREAISNKLRNFVSLLEITKAVNSELSKTRLLTMVVQKSIELVYAERGFLILLNDKVGGDGDGDGDSGGDPEMVFEVAQTRDGSAIENPEKQISTSVIGDVTTKGEPVITINAQNDLGSFMSIVALEVRSLICVPLKARDKILGALYVDSHVSTREFTEELLNLLQAFADQAAIALQNANLYDEVVESQKQEKRIRTVFQRYVPANVIKEVLNLGEGAQLSESKEVTVLFSDIRSFTSISERLQAEEVVEFLNAYLQRMVDIVVDEDGIVDKFIGDAVMAIWGAPVSREDDALRAVRAAVRMLDGVDAFNADQRKKGGVEIEIGIGLHTGRVVAGNVGSDKKMEYTVIGDTVNVASRVEGLCKSVKANLLITAETYRAVGGQLEVKAMPPVEVKGKSEKLHVYQVLRTNFAERDADPMPTAPMPAALPPGAATIAGAATIESISSQFPVGVDSANITRPTMQAFPAEEEAELDFEF